MLSRCAALRVRILCANLEPGRPTRQGTDGTGPGMTVARTRSGYGKTKRAVPSWVPGLASLLTPGSRPSPHTSARQRKGRSQPTAAQSPVPARHFTPGPRYLYPHSTSELEALCYLPKPAADGASLPRSTIRQPESAFSAVPVSDRRLPLKCAAPSLHPSTQGFSRFARDAALGPANREKTGE